MVSHSSGFRVLLMLLPSERASVCKPGCSSCRLAEDSEAANTKWLCVAKGGGDFLAPGAFHIPEVGIGALHQVLLLESPLLLERDEGHPLQKACSHGEAIIPESLIITI